MNCTNKSFSHIFAFNDDECFTTLLKTILKLVQRAITYCYYYKQLLLRSEYCEGSRVLAMVYKLSLSWEEHHSTPVGVWPLNCARGRFVWVKCNSEGNKDVYLMLQSELATLRERKSAMLALNVSTNRLITHLGASTSPVLTDLKDGVADLYRLWDETFQK